MIKKKNMLVCLALAALLSFTACMGGCGKSSPDGSASLSITDCMGRSVSIPADPQRIACMYAFIGHTAGMLDSMEKTVAVVNGLKRDNLITAMFPRVMDLPAPFGEGSINFEELLAQNPDLIFVRSETASNADQQEKLDALGVPWMMIDYSDMAGQQKAVRIMGDALNQEKEAALYNAYYDKCRSIVRERTQNIPAEKKVIVYHSVNEATRTDPADSISAEIIENAGGNDIATQEELKLLDNKYYASLEQIYSWDPDIILVNETGVPEYIKSNPQWKGLRAVREGKVIQMPVGISRWGHPGSLETPLALLWTGKTLYPELFTDIDMEKETASFYRDFFETELTPDQIARILAGQGMREEKNAGNR